MTRAMLRPFWFVGALLMMLDSLTTWIALTMAKNVSGINAREANPIAVYVIDHLGLSGMCILKAIIGVLCIWRLAAVADHGHRWAWMYKIRPFWWKGPVSLERVQVSGAYCLALSIMIMGIVVGNNLKAIADIASM